MLVESDWIVHGVLASIVASVHLWIGWFESRFEHREDGWVGFVGGVAVGYATLYMMPKLATLTASYIEANPDGSWAFQYRAYLILLFSILAHLVFERVSRLDTRVTVAAKWFELSVVGLYSIVVGYISVELPRAEIRFHVLANAILALHLMGLVHNLRMAYPSAYGRVGRIGFALLVMFGYLLGAITELPQVIVMSATAFTAGVILVNVMSEELPRGKEGRLRYFLVGASLYAVLAVLFART